MYLVNFPIQINECAAIVTSLNTTKMRVSSQKMVHNFLLLVRHRSPVLSACSFFHVDLRLLFAVRIIFRSDTFNDF